MNSAIMAASYSTCSQSKCWARAGMVGTKRKHSTRSASSASEEDTSGSSDEELEPLAHLPYDLKVRVGQDQQNKRQCVINPYLIAYLRLFEDEIIQDFLWIDSCAKLADKYLLAMVYIYFRRAGLPLESYNRTNFFIALYLANDIEEDEEDEKYEIFPWALGKGWMTQFPAFLRSRDQLWHAMGFRAVVSRRTCEEIFAMVPYHAIWERKRYPHHGGAIRAYLRSAVSAYGRTSPASCRHCKQAEQRQKDAERCSIVSGIKLDLLDEIDLSLQDPGYPTKATAGHKFNLGSRQSGGASKGGFQREE